MEVAVFENYYDDELGAAILEKEEEEEEEEEEVAGEVDAQGDERVGMLTTRDCSVISSLWLLCKKLLRLAFILSKAMVVGAVIYAS